MDHSNQLKIDERRHHCQPKYCSIEELIPHRRTMLLVDELIQFNQPQSGIVKATLKADKPYFHNGQFQSHWLTEMMAQSVSAVYTYSKCIIGYLKFKPALGYLISIDTFEIENSMTLKANDTVLIDVKLEWQSEPLGLFYCEAKANHQTLAVASMKFLIDQQRSIL